VKENSNLEWLVLDSDADLPLTGAASFRAALLEPNASRAVSSSKTLLMS
jgi:hypothetical protein